MNLKPGSKYHPLLQYLRATSSERLTLRFDEIESEIGAQLPRSAYLNRAFWSNRRHGGHQAMAWLQAGYRVVEIDLKRKRVTFEKGRVSYHVERSEGEIRWTAEMVRALRQHLEASQQEMATMLGVRQQTVSEWETAVYTPTRSRSKHLTMVAERSEFPFESSDGED
jgi:DNA-binding transcriptional regulator YiaG